MFSTSNVILSVLLLGTSIWIILIYRKNHFKRNSVVPSDKKKNSESKIIGAFKHYALPVLIGLSFTGILVYLGFKYSGSSLYNNYSEAFKEVFAISLAILSSGIFLATLKWFQFKGFFRDEIHAIIESSAFEKKLQNTLAEVLYSNEFLKNKSDLPDLWRRVNKALFRNQLSEEISESIEEKIQELFFRNENLSHHYRNMSLTYKINLDGDYIEIVEIYQSKIIRANEDDFSFPFIFYVDKVDENDDKTSIIVNKITVDGNSQDLAKIKEEINGNRIEKMLMVEAGGKKQYQTFTESILKWNINIDSEQIFHSQRFIDDLTITVEHCDDLQVIFTPLGPEQFEDGPYYGKGFVKAYHGLLLPEKGFKLLFVRKETKL